MIKAVFFDIDGTLLRFKSNTISPLTRHSLYALKRQEIKVFVATGRSFEQVLSVTDFPFDGYITSNGSRCLTSTGTILQQGTLPQKDLQNLAHHLHTSRDPFSLCYMTDTGIYANKWDDALNHHFDLIHMPRPPLAPLHQLLEQDVYQLTVYVDNELERLIMDKMMPQCESTRWHTLFADINNKKHNKATGVQLMLDRHHINRQSTMAFGDGGNDIKMLQYVEYGVAMGNAQPEVKEKARYITESVDNEGVWNALVRFEILNSDTPVTGIP